MSRARHLGISLARAVAASVLLGLPAIAAQTADFEGAARGFPALRDLDGRTLADGDFAQWIEDERLHVRIAYEFGDGRRIEERAVFRQKPRLVQEAWSWREIREGQLYRQFEVDFGSGQAVAQKREEGELERWSENLEIDPGRTFAGFGFTLAIKRSRERLVDGAEVELQVIGFTPRPRLVSVEISHGGVDQMRMADRVVRADRFVIQPKIPWIARLFVDVPDTRIWLAHPPPAGFVRWEGPLVEPDDSVVRVDLLPGGRSEPATPVGTSGRSQE